MNEEIGFDYVYIVFNKFQGYTGGKPYSNVTMDIRSKNNITLFSTSCKIDGRASSLGKYMQVWAVNNNNEIHLKIKTIAC